MGQVTIYLDDETEQKMRKAAKASGLSHSRWIALLVAEKTRTTWPEPVVRLAGAWKDLPSAEEIREGVPEDSARESL